MFPPGVQGAEKLIVAVLGLETFPESSVALALKVTAAVPELCQLNRKGEVALLESSSVPLYRSILVTLPSASAAVTTIFNSAPTGTAIPLAGEVILTDGALFFGLPPLLSHMCPAMPNMKAAL